MHPTESSVSLMPIRCQNHNNFMGTHKGLSGRLQCADSASSLSLILSLIRRYGSTPQIIFHKENPGIDYEFYVPMEKKDAERAPDRERERPVEAEWEAGRHPPRERSRERESGSRASLRSK